jgi:hypothetical protein
VAISADGRTRPDGRYRYAVALKPDTYERASRNGLRLVSAIDVAPGRYQLRVAAGASTGPAGGVVLDLEIPDFSGSRLGMSGLSVASKLAPEAVTQQTRNPLQGRAAMVPTTAREFDKGDVLMLFAEVYADGRRNPAYAIDLKATIVGAAGRVVSTIQEQRTSLDGRSTGGRLPFTPVLPINDAAAGDYVVRVEARENLPGGTTVIRSIPIRVR